MFHHSECEDLEAQLLASCKLLE